MMLAGSLMLIKPGYTTDIVGALLVVLTIALHKARIGECFGLFLNQKKG